MVRRREVWRDVVRCVGMWDKAFNKSSEVIFCVFHEAEGR